jgi:hypothetical protein
MVEWGEEGDEEGRGEKWVRLRGIFEDVDERVEEAGNALLDLSVRRGWSI